MPAAIFVLVCWFLGNSNDDDDDDQDHEGDGDDGDDDYQKGFVRKLSLDYWIVCQLPCWINIHHDDDHDQHDDDDDGDTNDNDDDDDLDNSNVIGLTGSLVGSRYIIPDYPAATAIHIQYTLLS